MTHVQCPKHYFFLKFYVFSSTSVPFIYHQFFFFFCDMPGALRCWHIPVLTVPHFFPSPLLYLLSSCSSFCAFRIIYIFSCLKCSFCLKQKMIYKTSIELLLIKLFLYFFILRFVYHFSPKENINEHTWGRCHPSQKIHCPSANPLGS